MKQKTKLITSWDDGHPMDLKIAELLDKYSVPGIFFIPIKNMDGRAVMNKKEIKELAKKFEIGAHTYSHIDLTTLSLSGVKKEILKGKEILEQMLGKKVQKFCYPRGHYNNDIKKLVKDAGFKYARNARLVSFSRGSDNFSINPHLHIYPHHPGVLLGHLVKNNDLKSIVTLRHIIFANVFETVVELSKRIKKEPLHIWGHSWEIKEIGYLEKLEKILKYFNDNK